MIIDVKRNDQELILELNGRLDTATAPTLDKMIAENTNDIKSLILDLKGLEYISSAGLRVVLLAQKKMQVAGTMKVKNVNEDIMSIFEMTGFADILTIE